MSNRVILAAVVVLTASVGSLPAEECFPTPDGLVAWWPGEGNANDVAGGHDGQALGGVSYATGMVGECFDLDGIDDFIEVPNAPELNPPSEITIGAWFQPVSFSGSGNNPIVDKGFTSHWTPPHYQYHLGATGDQYPYNPGSFEWDVAAGGSWNYVHASGAWTPGEWHLVVGTYDGEYQRVYVNGDLYGSKATSGSIQDYGSNVRIGVFNNLYSQSMYFTPGLIDEVFLFDRGLSEAEIAEIFAAGTAGMCKDEDGDGFRPLDDCDETDPFINPDAVELPGNFVDENCDGNLGGCDPCFNWKNHGEYVRCVAHAIDDLVNAGVLSEDEGDELVSSAAQSSIGKKGYVPQGCE